MTISLGIVMDPINEINVKKDSSFAMLLEAQRRGWSLWYMLMEDLHSIDGTGYASMQAITVTDNPENWYELGEQKTVALSTLNVILMRKDPPFDMEYIYSTYILENAEACGTIVVNSPSALRNGNEKLATTRYPDCAPAMLVSRKHQDYIDFVTQHGEMILKPLDGMGGASIFRISKNDPNLNVAIEVLTDNGTRYAMAQQFIPEITEGDKRILLIDGEPVPYTLARIPKEGETRGNLAAGGSGRGQAMTAGDKHIAEIVGPKLREAGILFAGIDVIGDFLTEINITSPTCIRELDKQFNLNISGQLMDVIEKKLNA